ncbi:MULTISPECIES: hypothetical protein [Bacillus]|nr:MULTISPECIES: hypothetical protein [Bacillus cereus group]NIE92203.1 hypothetical protein [Bacillus sp. Ab-1751]PEV20667.1 hypothetical protein CN420_25785 [Bacillus thuringiensis]PEX65840.1 hypothetical protein CN462_22070 [Bacillus cereus]PFL18585.1 hypothetical protein COJ22_26190 [Bacillus cereus]PFR56424.1 hypothetical protein COK36_28670 [Bacillus cereus]
MVETIRFIPFDKIIFYENYKGDRLETLINNMGDKKILINPPVAVQIQSNQYLILRGKYRAMALSKLRCMNITAQIVDEQCIKISSWLHQLPKNNELIMRFQENRDFYFSEKKLAHHKYMVKMYIEDKIYYLYNDIKGDIEEVIPLLNSIMEKYDKNYKYKKIIKEEYTSNSNYITLEFPKFSMQEIITLVNKGMLFPENIVRYIFNVEMLQNLMIPINVIRSPEAFEFEWREILDKLLKSV